MGDKEPEARKGALPSTNPDVVARRIDQGTVLINLRTNQIYELNTTGTRIWELLREGCDRGAILDRLLAEFEVDARVAAEAIDDTVAQLAREGLLGAGG